jgi:hypothetical protein
LKLNNDTDSLKLAAAAVEKKIGQTMLSDEDLFILACREIARTYTRDEKDYA